MARRWMIVAGFALVLTACGTEDGPADGGRLTVYSGREQDLVGTLLDRFTAQTGIRLDVRYGDTAELASQIVEEGSNSPADVFFAQDAGALGALRDEGLLVALPTDLSARVPERFRADDATWVGISGRARVVVYNTGDVDAGDLPSSILGFADRRWDRRIGWAPTNGSFQAFVTALRLTEGEQGARRWVRDIKANRPQALEGNTAIVEAVGSGEIDVGFVNHYYLLRLKRENPDLPVENHFIGGGDAGALVNVAGAGVLKTSDDQDAARRFIDFLLAEQAQRYFAEETFEYPLIQGVEPDAALKPLAELDPPAIDLSRLADLQATLKMLEEEGAL